MGEREGEGEGGIEGGGGRKGGIDLKGSQPEEEEGSGERHLPKRHSHEDTLSVSPWGEGTPCISGKGREY